MRFRAILMDNDGTLMDFEAGMHNAILEIFDLLNIKDPEGPAVYKRINDQCWKDFEKGILTQPQLKRKRFDELLSYYHLSASPDEMSRRYEDILAQQRILLSGALEQVQKISAKLPILILTNGISHVQHSRIDSSPLAPYLSGLLISTEVGAPKPHPDMYLKALEMLGGLKPTEVLMIGDSLTSDIQGAINAGIPACWYNPEHKARPDGMKIDFEIDRMEQMSEVALMD